MNRLLQSLGPWASPLGWLALEITVIVLVALAVQPGLRAAATRRSLWRAVLVALGGLLAVEFTGASSQLPAQLRAAWQATVAQPAPPPVTALPPSGKPPAALPHWSGPLRLPPSRLRPEPLPPAHFPTVPPTPEPPPAPSLWPAWLWLAGVAALLLRSAWTHAGFAWLRLRHFLPAAESLCQRVQALAARLGLRRPVRVLASERLRAPVAFGWLRPSVGVPGNFTVRFAPVQQDVILAHELAHLAARDPLWQLLADGITAALWWHPLAWVARRQHRLAGELAADAASLALPDGPVVLAECLLTLAQEIAATPGAPLGMVGCRSQLGQRVERLLGLRPGDWHAPSRLRLALQTTAAVLALAALALLPGCATNRSASEAPASMFAKWWHSLTKPKPTPIHGRVLFHGTPPPEYQIPLPPPVSAARANAPLLTRQHVRSPDGGLGDVLVYVQNGLAGQTFDPPTNTHHIRADAYEFSPYVSAVQAGQTIRWETHQTAGLNIHPTPTNPANREFNFRPLPSQPVAARFTAPEFFLRVKTDSYPWMFHYVSVFEHPYFAVTDAEGRFRFPRPLPPGRYTLTAVHRRAGTLTRELVVDPRFDPTKPLVFMLGTVTGRDAILRKLAATRLPEVVCDGIPLPEALRLLESLTKKHDPAKQGVSFGMRNTNPTTEPSGNDTPSRPSSTPLQSRTVGTGKATGPPSAKSPLPRSRVPDLALDLDTVLIHLPPRFALRDVSVLDALDAVVNTADPPIGFTIENHRVVFHPRAPDEPFASPRVAPTAPGANLRAKAERIVIPQVRFDGLPVPEVLEFLAEQARKYDPDRHGVSFLPTAHFPELPPGTKRALPPIPDGSRNPIKGAAATVRSPDLGHVIIRLGDERRNLNLVQILDAVCAAADEPITYRFVDYGIVVTPKDREPALPGPLRDIPVSSDLATQAFALNPTRLLTAVLRELGHEMSNASTNDATLNLSLHEYLGPRGFAAPPGQPPFFHFADGSVRYTGPRSQASAFAKLLYDLERSVRTPATPAYIVGVGDKLSVSVFRRDELQTTTTVREGGDIMLPLLDPLPVAGKSIAAVGADIKAAYKGLRQARQSQNLPESTFAHLDEPAITVIVRESARRLPLPNPPK